MTDALPDDELRALAEAATRGHWYVPETSQWKPTVRVLDPTAAKNWKRIGQVRQPEDAAFIAAANPTTVLALLDRLAHAEVGPVGTTVSEDGWKPGDPCGACGSTSTHGPIPGCRTCGRSDADDD